MVTSKNNLLDISPGQRELHTTTDIEKVQVIVFRLGHTDEKVISKCSFHCCLFRRKAQVEGAPGNAIIIGIRINGNEFRLSIQNKSPKRANEF